MDISTLIGLIVGMVVITLAILSQSEIWMFLNLPGFLIVVGGTFAATMIKFPLGQVFVALKVGLKAAFVHDKETPRALIAQAIELAKHGRKGGLMSLENVDVPNRFFKKGVQLCVDGFDLDMIRQALTSERDLSIQRHEVGEKIFRGIGDSAPAFGMIGTLVGLVQLLSNMDDPKAIGPAMAVALLTTLYGALIANLVALPIADKLETKIGQERVNMTLIIESVIQIHERQNPNVLAEMLEAYLPDKQRDTDAPGDGDAIGGPARNPA